MYIVNTVVSVYSLLSILIVSGCSDIIQSTPFVRSLIFADIDCLVVDLIRLVYSQTQAVNRVASVNALHHNAVFSGMIDLSCGVNSSTILIFPYMFPYIRRIHIRDINLLIRTILRPYLQVQRDHAVALVHGLKRIVIDTCFDEVLISEAIRCAFADSIIHMRLVRAMILNE